jgi:hypothetical protein
MTRVRCSPTVCATVCGVSFAARHSETNGRVGFQCGAQLIAESVGQVD